MAAAELAKHHLPTRIVNKKSEINSCEDDVKREELKGELAILESFYRDIGTASSIQRVAPGLTAISLSSAGSSILASEVVERVGGTPSNYQVNKQLKTGMHLDIETAPSINITLVDQSNDNARQLREIAKEIERNQRPCASARARRSRSFACWRVVDRRPADCAQQPARK